MQPLDGGYLVLQVNPFWVTTAKSDSLGRGRTVVTYLAVYAPPLPAPDARRNNFKIYGRGAGSMLSGLGAALRVITEPSLTFEQIRDNDGAYFRWSVCIFALASLLATIASTMIHPTFPGWESTLAEMGRGLLGGIAFTVLVYLIGRLLGGNRSWRKVFTVVFYTNVIIFPLLVVLVVLASLSGSPAVLSSLSGSPAVLAPMAATSLGGAGQPDFGQAGIGQWAGGLVGLFAILIVTIVALVAYWVWTIVITVKAIKTVNGFGTGKALGLLVIVFVVFIAASVPLSM